VRLVNADVEMYRSRVNDLILTDPALVGPPEAIKPSLLVSSMWGIGDNIHSRAVLRELTQANDVWLETSNPAIYHDLDVKLVPRAQQPRIRETSKIAPRHAPAGIAHKKVSYDSRSVAHNGSVLAAQFASCGVPMPSVPDFRMPVSPEWADRLWKTFTFPRGSKPLLVYRPIILSNKWNCPLRSPDHATYDALFRSICDEFFTVSIANLPDGDRIIGPEPQVDIRLHHGELDFEMMAALFAEASVAFVNPGFAPVLSQAVGTPTIVVYGGYECFATTHSHGARLTPTLPIDTDVPCHCFSHNCQRRCSKRISLAPAMDKIREFIDVHAPR
jgi:ADP-heptose:LPS heptosyltransferase